MRALACAISALALATPALTQETAPRESTAFTLQSGQPRTNEQESVRFDLADLSIKVMPETKTIEAVAVLDFTATAALAAVVVELDTLLTVSSVQVDGRELPADGWSNPEGRMTIPLAGPLAAGETSSVRIAYAGAPRVAPNAPWDGGFVWATTGDGTPSIATAVQAEGCDLFWPCIDHPLAEPKRVNLHITVPPTLRAHRIEGPPPRPCGRPTPATDWARLG